jgi:hypothetical protein
MVNTQRHITRYGSPWWVVLFGYTYCYGKAKYMDCESSLPLVLLSCGAIPIVYIFSAGVEIGNSFLKLFGLEGLQHELQIEKQCD